LDNQDSVISYVDVFLGHIELDVIMGLISTVIVLMVFFYLAFHTSKLSKHIDLPGVKLLKWSCLALAVTSIFSILFVFNFSSGENWVWPYTIYIVVSTVPMVTGAYGFAILIRSLIAEKN